jgi:ubiquilin
MKLSIKCSNDTKVTVEAAPEDSVLQLKSLIATELSNLPSTNSIANTPADSQRLIYAGRVLKDEDVLANYKMQDGHTVHLVKLNKNPVPSKKDEVSPVSASPVVPTAPANTPVTPQVGNLSALSGLGGLGALTGLGAGGMGGAGGLGGMGQGMPSELLNNDAFLQQMSTVMSQPGMIDMMLSQNPAFQSNPPPPEVRGMMQAMMSNPGT